MRRRALPKLLIVDDELGFRDLISFEMGSRGYDVVTAADGEEALRKAREENFDVVVCDLAMPRRDGLETLAALKKLSPMTESILITGQVPNETVQQRLKIEAYRCLSKPFELEELCGLIDQTMKKKTRD